MPRRLPGRRARWPEAARSRASVSARPPRGWAGPGAEAWWGYKKAGVSPILGGSVGFEITGDPDKLTDTVGDAADAMGDGIGSVKDSVTHWF